MTDLSQYDSCIDRRMQLELRNRIAAKEEKLRDSFAMAALSNVTSGTATPEKIAEYCYTVADAMMKARNK
jgi:hypothetical protein